MLWFMATTVVGALDFAALLKDTGLPLMVMGIFVVFMALILLIAFITWLPRLIEILARFHPEEEDEPTAAAKPVPSDELSEELVVVIAAAVASMIDEPHRVVQMRQLTSDGMVRTMEGRMQHHSSHQIRTRDRR